jgi:hypothetical protein
MGKIKKYPSVKLIIGFIFKDPGIYEKTKKILVKRFSKTDFESGILPFRHTDYYEKELGRDLKRGFIAFKKLIPPEYLSGIKITTNRIEEKFSAKGFRQINIDPGYLDSAKLVLASTKDYMHRVYLNKGIFAEITLFFQDKTFKPWEWTYPDYKSREYIAIFNRIRQMYTAQIKE